MYIKWMDTCIKIRVLTGCCCAGSGKSVMEDIKRDKCVHEMDGHMHKNKKYLQSVVVQVVVKKVSWRT